MPGKGVCGRSQLNAAKETSKRSSSSLDEQVCAVRDFSSRINMQIQLQPYVAAIRLNPHYIKRYVIFVCAVLFCSSVTLFFLAISLLEG